MADKPVASRTNTSVVLVIEDDPPIRALLQEVLREIDYEVITAHDGSSALQTIDTLLVDLITLDLDLPGISGGDFIKLLHERTSKVPPIIIITSRAPVPRALRTKVQAVITKPFDVDDFISIVHKHVSSPKDGHRRSRTDRTG